MRRSLQLNLEKLIECGVNVRLPSIAIDDVMVQQVVLARQVFLRGMALLLPRQHRQDVYGSHTGDEHE